MQTQLTADYLKKQFYEYRDEKNFNDNFRLRIHRSISWLKKAEEEKDVDIKFISLWIAFNAAYARDIDHTIRDISIFNEFLLRICCLDEDKSIYNLVWQKFSADIQLLFENKFVSQAFWDFHNEKITEKKYEQIKAKESNKLLSALKNKKTEHLLELIFKRLYTLRNQIIHGGSTYHSKVNREQLKDGSNILSFILPVMLQIMMENHAEMNWGTPFYPVVNG